MKKIFNVLLMPLKLFNSLPRLTGNAGAGDVGLVDLVLHDQQVILQLLQPVRQVPPPKPQWIPERRVRLERGQEVDGGERDADRQEGVDEDESDVPTGHQVQEGGELHGEDAAGLVGKAELTLPASLYLFIVDDRGSKIPLKL